MTSAGSGQAQAPPARMPEGRPWQGRGCSRPGYRKGCGAGPAAAAGPVIGRAAERAWREPAVAVASAGGLQAHTVGCPLVLCRIKCNNRHLVERLVG